MKCALCQGDMQEGTTTLPYELNEDGVVVIQGVPAWICAQCGEPFVQIEVLREVERMVEKVTSSGMTHGFVRYKKAA